ncbi:MAG TPA: hypothetical protein VFY06_15305 [Verrucomicrobiae bacterium]|nr:hypothetical protein [Verrucomicrobiae bacterium]
MKKMLVTLAALIVLGTTCQAQWVVYDPINNIQQILDQAENIAEYVDMVDNQVQQITQLGNQLQQLEQYNQAFGNPAQILNVTGVSALTSDLTRTPLGQTISAVEITSDGEAALTYDANGLYNQIGATFNTPSGNQIQRNANDYKPNEAINNATLNYSNVTANVLQRRQALKDAIASTTEALQSATTASEVQKLTGVLIGQNAALAATDKEIDQAVDVSVEQDIENRNDRQKQATAEQEEQKAEMVESFDNYRTSFQLNTQPPQFPTGNQ